MTAQPSFIAPIGWHTDSHTMVVGADRSLGSVLRRLREEFPAWIVIVRPVNSDSVYYYAYRGEELESYANLFPERMEWPVSQALDLHEWTSSQVARRGRATTNASASGGPASQRVVDLAPDGTIARVGEYEFAQSYAGAGEAAVAIDTGGDDVTASEHGDTQPVVSDIAGTASSASAGSASHGDEPKSARPSTPSSRPRKLRSGGAKPRAISVTLSAETQVELQVGSLAVVDFRVERTGAPPPPASLSANADPVKPIYVSLSANNDSIQLVRYEEREVNPPGIEEPRTGHFLIKGIREGGVRLAVRFQQGGTELGVISLAVEIVADSVSNERAQAQVVAAPREEADSNKLLLSIEEHVEGKNLCYRYNLYSEQLDVPLTKLLSKPLLDRGNGPAATARAFVERIYESVTRQLSNQADLKQLNRDIRALGVELCEELLEPDVARRLWKLRDRIKVIEIVAWEPYIPWELVRLKDPDSGEVDERYLAEYGMVRSLSDETAPRELPLNTWAFVKAAFNGQLFPPVGAELAYFTGAGAGTLKARGIQPLSIPATRDDFYDTLASGQFDVLHISCHAESAHGAIDRAKLVIGEETPAGSSASQPVEVESITVSAEARLRARRPLVFLNACETGRSGALLTAWGGWPNVFMRAGAGAFIGASWAVRDKPAAAFSTAFYESLLDGKPLPEAANAARAAAGKLGDASWLAFKVYGNPRARRAHA